MQDSPLLRAVQHGRTLVVDEADKAPLEVVCVLKGLVEDGFMRLADGRLLVANRSDGAAGSREGRVALTDYCTSVMATRLSFLLVVGEHSYLTESCLDR